MRRMAQKTIVRRDVVMIATRRHEQCSWITPHCLVEAKRTMVERLRFAEVSNVQMDVPHRRARGGAVPGLAPTRGNDALDVQRVRSHRKFTAALLPAIAWSVGVHLDSQSIGIPQVQCLAHQVIGHRNSNIESSQVCGKAAEDVALR